MIDQTGLNQTLRMDRRNREFPGPVVLHRPLTIDGRGLTLWAPAVNTPVLSVISDGICLKNLNLEIIRSGSVPTVGESSCALLVAPGINLVMEDIALRGDVLGLDGESGVWGYPDTLNLGEFQAGDPHLFKVKVKIPVTCRIEADMDGLAVETTGRQGDTVELSLRLDPLPSGTVLTSRGIVFSTRFRRKMIINGQAVPDGLKGSGQLVWSFKP